MKVSLKIYKENNQCTYANEVPAEDVLRVLLEKNYNHHKTRITRAPYGKSYTITVLYTDLVWSKYVYTIEM